MLVHFEFEISVGGVHLDTSAGKCIGNCGVHVLAGTYLADGLQRCGQIRSIARQHRRVGADLRFARRRVEIGA